AAHKIFHNCRVLHDHVSFVLRLTSALCRSGVRLPYSSVFPLCNQGASPKSGFQRRNRPWPDCGCGFCRADAEAADETGHRHCLASRSWARTSEGQRHPVPFFTKKDWCSACTRILGIAAGRHDAPRRTAAAALWRSNEITLLPPFTILINDRWARRSATKGAL